MQPKDEQPSPPAGEESQLIQRAKTDIDAFGELYERYVQRIYNYIYYRTGNHHDAEDLTARVFQRALNHIPKYEDRGLPFSAWLYRIAHNLVVNWHRDRKRRRIVSIDDLALATMARGEAPESFTEQREENELLLAAIRNLSEERQQLLLLKFVERLPNAEIGVIMGRSEGAIKSLYHRTLLSLREEIEKVRAQAERAPQPDKRGPRRKR